MLCLAFPLFPYLWVWFRHCCSTQQRMSVIGRSMSCRFILTYYLSTWVLHLTTYHFVLMVTYQNQAFNALPVTLLLKVWKRSHHTCRYAHINAGAVNQHGILTTGSTYKREPSNALSKCRSFSDYKTCPSPLSAPNPVKRRRFVTIFSLDILTSNLAGLVFPIHITFKT